MAITTIVKVSCDICNKEMSPIHKDSKTNMQVIFETEQIEGRSVKPYLSQVKIDICNFCLETMLKGNMLFASGAMGCNSYYFKIKEEKK